MADSLQTATLFVTVPCPVCGHADYEVVKAARYPGGITEEDLRRIYSASSDHQLLDQMVRCRSCSMHYVNPRPATNVIMQGYSAAEDPTFVAQNHGRVRTFHKVLSKALRIQGRQDGAGQRLLDIGCAGGACLAAAKDLNFTPVGVEPSRWMADYGRRTYGVEIYEGELKPGMFADQSFDVITLWDVLEHIPEPSQLLTLIRALLRPEGLFVLSYPDFQSFMGRILGERWPFWLSVHLLYYDGKTVARQLQRCGFQIQRSMPYWPTLELGYILQRAVPYAAPLQLLTRLLSGTALGRIPVMYNMGQRIVLAKKA